MKIDRIEYKKGEVIDRMRKSVGKTGGKSFFRWIRLMLIIAFLFSLFLSIDWYLPKAATADTLLHNSTNTSSGKWPADGGWGIPGGRYGEFVCETCHVRMATNIKSIGSTITTPSTTKGTLPGDGKTIIFDRTSGNLGDTGTMGDDSNTPRTSSNKICEVCHTYSTGTNGVTVHAYNSLGNNLGNHMESNAADCTVCHKHKDAFKAVACETCHGVPPTDATLASFEGKTTGSATAGKHATHTALPGITCDSCHKNYVMPKSSAVKSGFWDISISFYNFIGSSDGPTTAGTYSGQTGLSYNGSLGTGGLNCSTVYCHSGKSGNLDGANETPSWTGTVICGDCHKGTPVDIATSTLGNHARHAGNAAGQLNLPCSDCHGTNGAGGAGHLDGKIQWSLNTVGNPKIGSGAQYNGAASGTINNLAPSASYQSCTTIYCHSAGQSSTGGAMTAGDYKSPQWGGVALNCGSCHPNMSGGSGTGGHDKHTRTYSFACSTCHFGAGDETIKHADRSIDISFSGQAAGTVYSQDGTLSNGYGNCSTSYCHSNVQAAGGNAPATTHGNPVWGATGSINCSGCHTDMSTTNDLTLGTHQRHTNAPGIATYACSMCHGTGYSATTVSYTTHANGNIDTSFTDKAAGTTYSQAGINAPGANGYGTCQTSACHGRATKNWGFSTSLTLCEKCHGSAASIAVDNGFRDTAGSIGSAYAGTHKSHLSSIHNYSDQIHCDNCHVEPLTFGDTITGVGHTGSILTGPMHADLQWSDLATGNIFNSAFPGTLPTAPSHTPSYSGEPTRTCLNTYCHAQGGTDQSPTWGALNYLGGTGCDKCHGNPPSSPHPTGAAASNCKGCHYHVAASNTAFEATYRLIEGLCSKRTYINQTSCETNGGTWTPEGTNVSGKSLHVDGAVLVSQDECLGCHSSSSVTGDFPLVGEHALHTDNDLFLSILNTTATPAGGTGTSSGGSANGWTVSDSSQSWVSGALAGNYLRMTSGANKNKQIRIKDNTATTITLKDIVDGYAFSFQVQAGDTYEIRRGKTLSNDDYNDPGWIYSIEYIDGFPRYACGFCHPDNSGTHRNGVINLDMDPSHSLAGTVKTKNKASGPWFNQTTGSNVTCVAVYCHSTGYISTATNNYQFKTTPNWYYADQNSGQRPWASVDRCAQCHGNSPNTGGSEGSAAHAKHAVGIHQSDTFSGTVGKMSTAHGDGNSTTVNCHICHNDTVKVVYNDKNPTCSACHSGGTAKGTMIVEATNTNHVNGNVDVVFITPLNLKTKAQLRDSIGSVATVDNSWTRSNGYKKVAPTVSHDQTKITPVYSAGTCSSTACHNNTPMQWGQAGPLQCVVCHLGLPK